MEKSESIAKLAEALAKAQGAMTVAVKGSANPFFKSKYADLASIMEAIRGPLTSNGIAVVQTTDIDDSGVIVETVLMHSSGEWIGGRLRMPVVPKVDKETKASYIDPQGVGSAITYGRRYGLQSMVSLPSDDDDGNAASGNTQQPAQAQRKAAEPKPYQAPDLNLRQQQPIQDLEVGRQQALARLAEQSANTVEKPLSDEMPDGTPREILTWFMRRLATVTITPKPTAEQIGEKATSLARTLKTAGLSEKDRADAYQWLTGEVSGKDMSAKQLALLFRNATRVDLLQRCAMAERENRTGGDDPDAPVPLMGVVAS